MEIFEAWALKNTSKSSPNERWVIGGACSYVAFFYQRVSPSTTRMKRWGEGLKLCPNLVVTCAFPSASLRNSPNTHSMFITQFSGFSSSKLLLFTHYAATAVEAVLRITSQAYLCLYQFDPTPSACLDSTSLASKGSTTYPCIKSQVRRCCRQCLGGLMKPSSWVRNQRPTL